MNRKFILSFIALMLIMALPVVASASEAVNFDKDFAIYILGPNDGGSLAFDIYGSAEITGDVVVNSGSYHIGKSWGTVIHSGMLYPNAGSVYDTKSLTDYQKNVILGMNILAQEADFTATLPTTSDHGLPWFEESKGDFVVSNGTRTISESGKYSSITISGANQGVTAALVFDVTGGKVLHIVTDQLVINGDIQIVGDGKVYLYMKSFSDKNIQNGQNGNAKINVSTSDVFGDKNQLTLFVTGNDRVIFSGSAKVAADVYAPNSDMRIGGNVKVVGNIFAGGQFEFMSQNDKAGEGSNEIYGLLNAPNANLVMQGTNKIYGSLIVKQLEMFGSARVFKQGVSGWNFEIERFGDPVDPPPTNYVNGLLGEYYDAGLLTEESALRKTMIDTQIAFNFGYDSPYPVIEKETFAIRWTGFIKPEVAGNYTFKTYSDDGVVVTINDQTVIDRWGLLSLDYTQAVDSVYLEADTYYPITVEYQQLPLYAAIFLFWEADTVSMSLVPQNVFYVEESVYNQYSIPKYTNLLDGTGAGLSNVFYALEKDGVTKKDVHTEVSLVNYPWGAQAPGDITDDVFFGELSGYIEARFTGELTLEFIVDDGIKVWINNELVIDAWDSHSDVVLSYTFDATVGEKYEIYMEYCDLGLGATLIMRWSSLLQELEIVPAKYLYTEI